MDWLRRDLRFAVRSLFKNTTFTIIAVTTLALGIGTSSAMFTIVNAVLLDTLPYGEPERIVLISGSDPDGRFGVSERERARYLEQTSLFEDFGTYVSFSANVTGDGDALRLRGTAMDAAILSTLSVRPVLGRGFSREEEREGADAVALVSYDFWRNRYGGGILSDETITVNGRRRTIVGVLPPEFRLPGDFLGTGSQIYVPLALSGEPDPRNIHYLTAVARLPRALDVSTARSQLVALSARLQEEIESLPPNFVATAIPVEDEILGEVRPALTVLLVAVALVLLIACVNVAHLYLVRCDARRRELGIRTALGASRSHLVVQLALESIVLAALGGALGVLLALGITDAVIALDPPNVPRISTIGVDAQVVAFAALVSALTAILFGLVPTLQLTTGGSGPALLGTHGTASGPKKNRIGRTLVIAEVSLAVVLASGAGLLAKSFLRLTSVDPGFDPKSVLTSELTLPSARYAGANEARRFYEELLGRVRALPGVSSAGAVSHLPLASDTGDWGVRIEGREEERLASGRRPWAQRLVVTDGYLDALGRQLLEGRFIRSSDTFETLAVVVINHTMSDRYWPNESAVGKRFKLSSDIDPVYRTIVGVVSDVRHDGLDTEVLPEMYLPHSQFPSTDSFTVGSMSLVVRSSYEEPSRLASMVRNEVREMDAQVPLSSIRTMTEVVQASISSERLNLALFGFFGLLALVLVSVGVYGVFAYLVSIRTREFGVRLALGARPRLVLGALLRQGFAVALAGVGIGVVGALMGGRALQSLLYGVRAYDPPTLAVVATLVLAVALAASYLPARRVLRIQPVEILRDE